MTICKGTSPEDGSETIVLILEHVTSEQLEALKGQLTSAFERMPDDPDSVAWHGLFNLLCDLEVEGYEAP
jgi:hypothetical protein